MNKDHVLGEGRQFSHPEHVEPNEQRSNQYKQAVRPCLGEYPTPWRLDWDLVFASYIFSFL
jgi:hypothetical protein